MPDRYASYDELARVSAAVKELAAEQARFRDDMGQIRNSTQRMADAMDEIRKSADEMREWLEGRISPDGTRTTGLLDKIDILVKQRLWLKTGIITIASGVLGTFGVAAIRLVVDIFGPALLKH